VIVAAFWSLLQIPCPMCVKPLGRAAFWTAIGVKLAAAQCPHCNVSFDAGMPGSPPARM
jgi:hypothetical protein